jgi:hypothetical protein
VRFLIQVGRTDLRRHLDFHIVSSRSAVTIESELPSEADAGDTAKTMITSCKHVWNSRRRQQRHRLDGFVQERVLDESTTTNTPNTPWIAKNFAPCENFDQY